MFVQIKDLPDYMVSDTGEVISFKYGKCRTLKPSRDPKGYLRVDLIGKTYKVHRLVAVAFLGESSLVVNHKNGIKDDNRIENLEYCTVGQNNQHAYDLNLHKNTLLATSKLSDVRASALIALKGKIMQKEAALLFGVSPSHVSKVWAGKKRKKLQKGDVSCHNQ